jgi:hypothetical protein
VYSCMNDKFPPLAPFQTKFPSKFSPKSLISQIFQNFPFPGGLLNFPLVKQKIVQPKISLNKFLFPKFQKFSTKNLKYSKLNFFKIFPFQNYFSNIPVKIRFLKFILNFILFSPFLPLQIIFSTQFTFPNF